MSSYWTLILDHTVRQDIARQLVEDSPGKDIDIVLGGGREAFTPLPSIRGHFSDF